MSARTDLANLPRFAFGDTPEMADDLLAAVLDGRKTATCSPVCNHPSGRAPQPGARAVVLNSADRPGAVIEVVSARRATFGDVDEAHALAESNPSLADWRKVHEAWLRRTVGFEPDIEVYCIRFRMIARLGEAEA